MNSFYRSLDELRAVRTSYIESARSNNFEDGLRSLLADLYPDNAHFIYELLQNAEDANAEAVQFDLRRTGLAVMHDGSRLFQIADVESITGIGQSTKKDDETQIGKFGVGFKAVFAYTNRPEVRSGAFAFAIEDLFVPEKLPGHVPDELTTFLFPFDRSEKAPDRAFDEIKRGLLELGESTVLFLKNVRDISFTIEGGTSGQVIRHEDTSKRIRIEMTIDGETSESMWLRLSGMAGPGQDVPAETPIAAAFNLSSIAGRGPENSRVRVVPLERGDTCIYFPAAKESSGLRFHIHAPFASTVARDSVRDTPENAQLLLAIADLVAGELISLRDEGYLDDGFLSALPNNDDALSVPYAAMRSRIQDAFRSSEVTPVFGGGYARASTLLASPAEFRRGLDQEDLQVLLELLHVAPTTVALWISPRDGRAGRFLQSLRVPEFGWDRINDVLDSLGPIQSWWAAEDVAEATARIVTWTAWLGSKSDEQLAAFYELVGLGCQSSSIDPTNLKQIPIIRVSGDAAHHFGAGVFLPESPDDPTVGRVRRSLAYFPDDESTNRKSYLEAFFAAAGVKRWDHRAQIDLRLKPYRDHDWPEEDEHLDDMRRFIAYAVEARADHSLFAGVHFMQVTDRMSGESLWRRPIDAFVDDPFRSTGLTALHSPTAAGSDGNKYPVAPLYASMGEAFVEFAVSVGCQEKVTVDKSNVYLNPEFQFSWTQGRESAYSVRRDFDVNDFERAVASSDETLLRSIWRLACETQSIYATALFQLNRSSSSHRIPSTIAARMRAGAWIVDIDGALQTPNAMTVDRLRAGWPEPPSDSLASKIGFGSDAAALEEKESARREEASHLGISLELVDAFAGLRPDAQARVLVLIDSLKEQGSFPESASADPVRRAAFAGSDASEAIEWETELRQRQVPVGNDIRERARVYLRAMYTDSDGVMWCQACQSRMPFKINGVWYFSAVQCVKARRYLHPQNFLALCPLCAARYQFVRDTPDESLIATVDGLTVEIDQGQVVLPVSVEGKRIELVLTGKHAIDLKAALAVAGGSREAAISV